MWFDLTTRIHELWWYVVQVCMCAFASVCMLVCVCAYMRADTCSTNGHGVLCVLGLLVCRLQNDLYTCTYADYISLSLTVLHPNSHTHTHTATHTRHSLYSIWVCCLQSNVKRVWNDCHIRFFISSITCSLDRLLACLLARSIQCKWFVVGYTNQEMALRRPSPFILIFEAFPNDFNPLGGINYLPTISKLDFFYQKNVVRFM